ncbi:protein-export chaperone SecB [Sneathiella sp.]|uniref:protein-export chaperone SecB n=1 Tax=Sneathiella sp. TaxID=1964365 RepID=UPI00356B1D0E
MSENGQDKQAANGAQAAEPQKSPTLAIIRQYVKDLSFENPNAPDSLSPEKGAPAVTMAVNIQAKAVGENLYEVELRIEAKGQHDEAPAFVVELVYGGLFQLMNFPADTMELVCMIECPRLLFPFARRVIADATRDGGFSPLLLDPIDFANLFRDHKAQQTAQQAPAGTA